MRRSSEYISRNGSLYDLAISRLATLFPGLEFRGKKKPIEQKVARERAAKATVIPKGNARCTVRACPFPAVKDGLCRSHLSDLYSECSVLPSTAGGLVSGRLIA
jgi:hypothetical protein